MTIGELLTEQARARPQALALVDDREGRTLSFAGLADEVGHAAAWWQSHGLRRGQAVLVFVPMSADLYVALLALFRLGAVALFLDPSAGREHIDHCCSRWAPDALLAISKAHLLRLRSRALRRIPIKASIGCWIPGARGWPRRWRNETFAVDLAEPEDPALVTFTSGSTGVPKAGLRTHRFLLAQYRALESSIALTTGEVDLAEPEDPALVTFTSGSTGVPKAGLRTHRFLLAQYRALESSIALTTGEVDLATLPVFVLANLAAGVTTVIPDVDLRRPGAVDAGRVFAQIERHGVTRLTASPAFMERLIEYGRASGRTLPALRKLYTGGAPVFPRLLEALREFAPMAEAVAVYGSTEAEPIAHVERAAMRPDDLEAMRSGRGLLAGTPVQEVTLRILQDRWGTPRAEMTAAEFARETKPPGEAGEIVVTGEHVLKGYLGGVGDDETKFQVGGKTWHRTGDAGFMDEFGRLWLLGRCVAKIDGIQGSLYPLGIECAAMAHPEVRRAAALSHAGKRLLVIEADEDESLEVRLRKATAWASLDEVIFVNSMPVDKRHNAKIDYPALRRQFLSGR
jgi:acyl-CoA synthetase (AMP-forming)/AMP-acid ligase II